MKGFRIISKSKDARNRLHVDHTKTRCYHPLPGEELLPSVAPGNALSPEGGVPGGVLSSLPESPSDDLCKVQ